MAGTARKFNPEDKKEVALHERRVARLCARLKMERPQGLDMELEHEFFSLAQSMGVGYAQSWLKNLQGM